YSGPHDEQLPARTSAGSACTTDTTTEREMRRLSAVAPRLTANAHLQFGRSTDSVTTRIAIHGAAGRMGKRLVALASADPQLHVVAALDSPQHPRLGADAGVEAGCGQMGIPLAAT